MMSYGRGRRRLLGAEVISGGVDFRVHAPKRRRVALVLEDGPGTVIEMRHDEQGFFRTYVPKVGHGTRYRFRLDDDPALYPDVASRFQPQGPHGPSMVIDPHLYDWHDGAHLGATMHGQILYEMHIGTFTQEGTFASAMLELPALADIGITMIELMPLADFPGRFGWGYDGVNLYAPTRLYGTPDELRRFVDAAHALNVNVVLDVVYNHLGPDGNYVTQFIEHFLSPKHTDWGATVNFDGPGSDDVRALCIDNAAYWIDEFHLDGLRIDAAQEIYDTSSTHVITEIVNAARMAARPRAIVILAEHERQVRRSLVPADQEGYGCDAVWNDDFHHSAVAAVTGHTEAYYSDTRGTPQELISALKWGYLFQGQYYGWQKQNRGEPVLDMGAERFVLYLENHDQLANSATGHRLHRLSSPEQSRALRALLLLAPGTPMLFQGQEFDASTPFYYFADHAGDLGTSVRDGRIEFMSQFPSARGQGATLPDPCSQGTFIASKLDHRERVRNVHAVALTRDLITLRKSDAVFREQRADRMHGAVLDVAAFALRFFGEGGDDRLVLVNFGQDLDLIHAAEPLLAPPMERQWRVILSTDDVKYGGIGAPSLDATPYLHVRGHSTTVLAAIQQRGARSWMP